MDDSGAFQAMGKKQGDWFEESSRRVLEDVGFTIDAQRAVIADAGVEVDIIATNRQQISFYFTCKGSWRGRRPGARRTDTFKKAVAEALMLHAQGWGRWCCSPPTSRTRRPAAPCWPTSIQRSCSTSSIPSRKRNACSGWRRQRSRSCARTCNSAVPCSG
jgi:hypothetical protein